MKKLLFMFGLISVCMANEYGIGNVEGHRIGIQSANTAWFILEIKKINLNNVAKTFNILTKKTCNNPQLRKYIEEGKSIEYIYISHNNKAVAIKIDSCK